MFILNLIAKSLWRERGLFGLWMASLCIAVTGLVIVDVFRNSLTQTLRIQGQKILTADISISARRPLSEAERKAIFATVPKGTAYSTMTEMFAMVSAADDRHPVTRLASLRFIDGAFPLIGDLIVEREGIADAVRGDRFLSEPSAWVAPDILTLMNVKVGDRLKIGKIDFKIAGVVRKDSSQTFRFGNMAPRIYLPRRELDATGLISFGSNYSESLFLRLQRPLDLKANIEKQLPDPAVQVSVPTDLEQGSLRVLSRLLDFLGLISLVTLSLGWIGVYYLGRRWLNLEAPSAGILKCLGLTERELERHLLLKLTVVMVAGIGCGGVLAWIFATALLPLAQSSLPSEFVLVWSWPSTALLLVVGPLAGLLLLWPALKALSTEQPLNLVQGTVEPRNLRELSAFVATTAILFFAVTLGQARSWHVTFIFLGALLGTLLVVSGAAYLLLRLFQRIGFLQKGWRGHLAVSLWTRRRGLAVLLIAVSAMAGLLAQLVPHLQKTLVGELESPPGMDRPALFLFDIQDDQLGPLTSYLAKNQITISQTAPFIRARILKVNGVEFERTQTTGWSTREAETDAHFRNRGVNLSYREKMSKYEQILQGKPWAKMNPRDGDISVEQGYADRLGLKLGDALLFDIQGVELNAKIASLRGVDWDSFEPNFFIMFPAGAIDDAPKTWVMTIKRTVAMTPPQMQILISRRFPSVTSINVQEALDNAAELFAKLSSGLKLASGLCLALGLFVFLMILLFQLASSRQDSAQLHVLGLRRRELLSLNIISYGGLCFIGLIFGATMSIAVSWALAHFAFASHLSVDWMKMIEIFFISLTSATVGMILISFRQNEA